jgi:hypothetical protein
LQPHFPVPSLHVYHKRRARWNPLPIKALFFWSLASPPLSPLISTVAAPTTSRGSLKGPGRLARGGLGTSVEGNESRSLEVVTNHFRAGYLRKNGVPYSDKAIVIEYYDRYDEPNGEEWFTVTTFVTDPVYLSGPFVTTTDFKKERDGSKFDPSVCTSR